MTSVCDLLKNDMKKLLAYFLCAIATFIGCWCLLFVMALDYSERTPYAFGASIAFIVALLFAGWGNSLTWRGKE